MGLFDLFRRASPQPQPRPDALLAKGVRRRFPLDPAAGPDPAKAADLAQLFAVPRDRRDPAWVARFWDSAWTAALAAAEPPIATGPDGFPYLRLHLPAGQGEGTTSLMNAAADLAGQGAGAAFFAAPAAAMADAQYVVPMGVIESILRFDHPDGDPAELEEMRRGRPSGTGATTLAAGEQILVGTPSSDYLSPAAARALDKHLRKDWGLADPRVAILVSHALCPARSLVIGHKRSELIGRGATDDQIAGWMHRIGWCLPPSRGLMLMPEDWSVDQMTPLSELS